MKLQEFLLFKKKCFVCDADIEFNIVDWTDVSNPMPMHLSFVYNTNNIIKFSHDQLSIFVLLKTNVYTLSPNKDSNVFFMINGLCSKNRNHYSFESQMLKLDHIGKNWGIFPEIDLDEVISIDEKNILSVVSSYNRNTTTTIFNNGKNHTVLPLINSNEVSFKELQEKLSLYLTFL